MSNPALGLLVQGATASTEYSFEYRDGKYIAQATSPTYQGEIFSFVDTPELFDATITVDVGIGGADEREIYGFVGCRAGSNDQGYLFLLEPTTGRAALWRQDAAGPVLMAETFVKNLVTPGVSQFNRLGIDCFGNQITGAVNGTIVLTETDNTYPSGLAYIGIGNSGGAADNLFGVFDNLTVVDQGGDFAEPTLGGMLAGPLSGNLTEQASTISAVDAGVNTADFFATATFAVPSNSVPWDVSLVFRQTSANNEYRLTLFSDGQWTLSMGTGSAIASGQLANLSTVSGQLNTIDLLVQGTSGAASLNGQNFATLDLSANTSSGDVSLATATTNSTTQVGRTTQYSNFEVWSLA